MPPKLTVVVPMYNSAPTVAQSIESVLAQTFTDWRMVVVNDGSTDSGPKIVEEFARRDPRITMTTQANRGLGGARNTGIEEALRSGSEHVHFLDADDWMTSNAYEWLIAAAQETGASYGGYELRDADGRTLGRQSPMSAPLVGLSEQIEWNRAATHALLFRTELLKRDRFDESLRCVEDYDLWLRLASRGVCWKGVERIVCGYRLRPDSMSKKFAAMAATYEMVLRRAALNARESGWPDRGVDLSERRLTRVLGSMNLCYATMDALLDPLPNKARATALLDSRTHPERFTAADAAQAACTALLFGACLAPELDGWSERRWLSPLRQWWVRCAEENWLTYDDIVHAFVELARKVVHPDTITNAMLNEAEKHGHAREHGVVIVGIDRQGRRLARQCAARGWRVLVLDDHSDRREAECLEPITGVRTCRNSADYPAAVSDGFTSASWMSAITTPNAPSILRNTLASARVNPPLVQHWAEHRDVLGQDNLRRMNAALAMPRAMAG